MYYYIEAYILSFLTYTLLLAANQDWTGHLTLTMGARYHIAANQDWTGDLFFTIGQATNYYFLVSC